MSLATAKSYVLPLDYIPFWSDLGCLKLSVLQSLYFLSKKGSLSSHESIHFVSCKFFLGSSLLVDLIRVKLSALWARRATAEG